jgi:hypothetical protein
MVCVPSCIYKVVVQVYRDTQVLIFFSFFPTVMRFSLAVYYVLCIAGPNFWLRAAQSLDCVHTTQQL